VEVLKEAEQFANNNCSRDALKNLNEIFSYLKTMGLSDYITIDLGNANAMHYYSGIVFKGITKFSGSPILAGGRYDDLCKSFNKSLPATGFAIGIKNLLISLDRAGKLFRIPKVDFMVGYEEGAEATVLQHINKLRNDGFTVVNTFINDEQKFVEIKNLKKAFSYIYIRKSGEIKTLNG
jgi:ATP phosphoribosyltransferase regulatory subunit